MDKYKVGILGATGLVGQRLVQLLDDHPWFELTALAASERSSGRVYADVVRWRLPDGLPRRAGAMQVQPCRVDALEECDFVVSSLDSGVAADVESSFAGAGFAVISNSSAFRQRENVPLVIPEVNPEQLAVLDGRADADGYVVTNPNCSVTGLALAIAPLHREFHVRRLIVATLQAVSGAGSGGPRALDLTDNVLPYIRGEEEKMEIELGKIFGEVRDGKISPAPIEVSAHCHRVPTVDGHLEAVSVELVRPVDPQRAVEVLRGYRGEIGDLGLPSSPQRPIVVRDEPDRPQPRLDRRAGGGMSVVVGRVRRCPVLGLKLALLSHNTIRGAAGGTVLNAELLAARRLLPRRSRA